MGRVAEAGQGLPVRVADFPILTPAAGRVTLRE
jgi:hypothetical protein